MPGVMEWIAPQIDSDNDLNVDERMMVQLREILSNQTAQLNALEQQILRLNVEESPPIRIRTEKIPPIIVDINLYNGDMKPILDAVFKSTILDDKKVSIISASDKEGYIYILSRTVDIFKTLKQELIKKKVHFYTYTLRTEKISRRQNRASEMLNDDLVNVAMLKGIPVTVELEVVNQALTEAGLTITKCIEIRKREETEFPFYFVRFSKKYKLSDLNSNYGFLCYSHVKWNRVTKSHCEMQCYRCQRYGHAARNCNMPPKCKKCSGKHLTKDCFTAKMKDISNTIHNKGVSRQFLPKRKNMRRRKNRQNNITFGST